jgi:hypothetical protein
VSAAVFALIISSTAFVSGLSSPASADEWGAWKSAVSSECLFAGTNIVTTDSPNLHNIGVGNSCATNYSVKVVESHYDSDNRLLDQCTQGYSTNYDQCSIQAATTEGDYWIWVVYINIGGTIYNFSCDNNGESYYDCYHTDDPS